MPVTFLSRKDSLRVFYILPTDFVPNKLFLLNTIKLFREREATSGMSLINLYLYMLYGALLNFKTSIMGRIIQ